jgi:hypothetical protein
VNLNLVMRSLRDTCLAGIAVEPDRLTLVSVRLK